MISKKNKNKSQLNSNLTPKHIDVKAMKRRISPNQNEQNEKKQEMKTNRYKKFFNPISCEINHNQSNIKTRKIFNVIDNIFQNSPIQHSSEKIKKFTK